MPLFDVLVFARRPHEPSTRECVVALAVYVGLALAFGVWVWNVHGGQFGLEFVAGWLTEYSLSVDNLFIFIIIMASFKVPRQYQQQALLIGIVIALVFRGIFIALGAVAIQQFSWSFYLFGAFLVVTAVKLARDTEHSDDADNAVVRLAKTYLNTTDQWRGMRLYVKAGRKRLVTPMFLVVLALGTTDLLFALDSIPAIYGLTREPYLVFTANVFALMGLRQLYSCWATSSTDSCTCPRAWQSSCSSSGSSCCYTPCMRIRCRSSTAANRSRCRRSRPC